MARRRMVRQRGPMIEPGPTMVGRSTQDGNRCCLPGPVVLPSRRWKTEQRVRLWRPPAADHRKPCFAKSLVSLPWLLWLKAIRWIHPAGRVQRRFSQRVCLWCHSLGELERLLAHRMIWEHADSKTPVWFEESIGKSWSIAAGRLPAGAVPAVAAAIPARSSVPLREPRGRPESALP